MAGSAPRSVEASGPTAGDDLRPGGAEQSDAGETKALAALAIGEEGVIASLRVAEEEGALLRAMGLLEGQTVRLLRRGLWGGPLQVRVGEASFAIGRSLAAEVMVRAGKAG